MKVLIASVTASLLGFIGHWVLEGRDAVERWAGIDDDIKWGGSGD